MVAAVTTGAHVMATAVEAAWVLPIMAAALPGVLTGIIALMPAAELTTRRTAIALRALMPGDEEVSIREPEPTTAIVIRAPMWEEEEASILRPASTTGTG